MRGSSRFSCSSFTLYHLYAAGVRDQAVGFLVVDVGFVLCHCVHIEIEGTPYPLSNALVVDTPADTIISFGSMGEQKTRGLLEKH